MDDLVALPQQPEGVPWPTAAWPSGDDLPPAARRLIDEMFDDTDRFEQTYAVLVAQHGKLRFERYGGALQHWEGPDEPVDEATRLLSWSMAKSILHAAVGVAVADGLLRLDAPAPVPEWSGADDIRHGITLEHLLTMRDGLDFKEDYVDGESSHVIEMLFGSGQSDVGAFAAGRPARAEPGTLFSYSSGTSNIVARLLGTALGGEEATRTFLRDRLFDPIGMRHTEPRFDDAGTFVGSSYVYLTARDLARFGLLYLRDGTWDGERLLPEGWVDHARRQRSWDPVDQVGYGAHWWVVGDDLGTFRASGYDGQMLVLCPARDLVVVRFGKTSDVHSPDLIAWRTGMVDAFR